MKRSIITMDENGKVTVSNHTTEIWMNETELAELFGVIVPTIRAGIEAVYKSGALKAYEAERYIRLDNGLSCDVFSLSMLVALAFRIDSYGTKQVHNFLLKRMMHGRKEKTGIILLLNMGKSSAGFIS
ncbi:hypothetical protein [Odoribacter lunatus]|uniref:hypothetical protein n=1 Tax=Odoribacter lunatus TaxID=2941335 RepID=UPI00203FC50B|nr:hypothetical protein [Odoribacter lunatus]